MTWAIRYVNSLSHNGHWVHAPCTPCPLYLSLALSILLSLSVRLSHTHRTQTHTVSAIEMCHPCNHQRVTPDTKRSMQRLALSSVTVGGARKEKEEKDEGDDAKISTLWESDRWPHAGCHLPCRNQVVWHSPISSPLSPPFLPFLFLSKIPHFLSLPHELKLGYQTGGFMYERKTRVFFYADMTQPTP